MPEHITYSRFHTATEAKNFAEKLQQAGIEFTLEEEKNLLDNVYIGQNFDALFVVKIAPHDFEKADTVLSADPALLEDVTPDYYLFSFSAAELTEVIRNKEEWNYFDRALAGKIMREKFPEVNVSFITPRPGNHTPARLDTFWLVMEYLMAIYFIFAGVVIGLATFYAYKTLSDGRRVKMYDRITRYHALAIFSVSVVRTIVHYWLIFRHN